VLRKRVDICGSSDNVKLILFVLFTFAIAAMQIVFDTIIK
jgi:hypothetical protein